MAMLLPCLGTRGGPRAQYRWLPVVRRLVCHQNSPSFLHLHQPSFLGARWEKVLGTHSASCTTCSSPWAMGVGWGHGATNWCSPSRLSQQHVPSHELCFPLPQQLLLWLLWC